MTIKYLSINNEVLNIENIPKLDAVNVYTSSGIVYDYLKDDNDPKSHKLHVIQCATNMQKGSIPKSYRIGQVMKLTESHVEDVKETFAEYCMKVEDISGDINNWIKVYRNIVDNSESSDISINYNNANNSFYTHCPTPTNVSNGTEIATTKWVRDLMKRCGISVVS